MSQPRRARVRALAKLNLDLRVLGPRADGYHELRTIFQTISLADSLDISFQRGRAVEIEVDDGGLGIPDNLAGRAARLALDAMKMCGRVDVRLRKRIPMGAGLGGGSSDAAAVLLALPVLADRPLSFAAKAEIARSLGSDVGFFLLGGRAVGIGRGDELFPLADTPRRSGLLIAPGIHVNTAQAYRDLNPLLSEALADKKARAFQAAVWGPGVARRANDFEDVVFEQHPRLAAVKRLLVRAGAVEAGMTGSGSAVFGFFDAPAPTGIKLREGEHEFLFSTVSRAQYRGAWLRALGRDPFDNAVTAT